MEESKTKKTSRNIVWGISNKIVHIIIPFVIRTIIIKEIGIDYLGINTLFVSLLSVLSLAELGLDSSVVFVMYRGVAHNDIKLLNALLAFIRKMYRFVGCFILFAGLICIPFLPYFINDIDKLPSDINIYLIYVVFLANTALGYFIGSYRNCLLCAHQRNDVISYIDTLVFLSTSILQIILLILFKNYYLYILLLPLTTISNNLLVVYESKKLFPLIRPEGRIEDKEKKELTKLISGSFIGRLGTILSITLDSVVISALLGVRILAYYSNYYYIISSLMALMTVVYTSMQGAMGVNVIIGELEKNKRDLDNYTFIYNWIIGVCTIMLYVSLQPFIKLWIGEEGVLPDFIMVLMCVYFYVVTCFGILGTYKIALGIVWEDRYRPLIGGLINLFLNILLVTLLRPYGEEYALIGVIGSTILVSIFVTTPWSAYLTFKKYFKIGLTKYYVKIMLYFSVTALICMVSTLLFSQIPEGYGFGGILWLALRLLIAFILSNVIFILSYSKTKEFAFAKDFILQRFIKYSNRIR